MVAHPGRIYTEHIGRSPRVALQALAYLEPNLHPEILLERGGCTGCTGCTLTFTTCFTTVLGATTPETCILEVVAFKNTVKHEEITQVQPLQPVQPVQPGGWGRGGREHAERAQQNLSQKATPERRNQKVTRAPDKTSASNSEVNRAPGERLKMDSEGLWVGFKHPGR